MTVIDPANEPSTLSNALRSTERYARECEAVRCIELMLEELSAYSAAIPEQSTAQGQAVLLDVEQGGLRCVVLRAEADTVRVKLSPREQEIARMVAKGYPNKTIAAVLEISTWTVNTHLRRMFAKLDVHSRAALIAKWLGGGVTKKAVDINIVPDGEGTAREVERSQDPTEQMESPKLDER